MFCQNSFYGTFKNNILNVPKKTLQFVFLAFSFTIFFVLLSLFLSATAFAFLPLTGNNFNFDFIAPQGAVSASGKLFRIFIFTFAQSFFSAVIAVCIGLSAAYFCANKQFKSRRFLLSLSSIPLCVPAVIIALSYILFFGNNGFFTSFLKMIFKSGVKSFLYSMSGIIICQGFYNFPIAMRSVTEAWHNIPHDEEDAALLLGAGKIMIFFTVTLPQLLPSILSSFLIVFLFCFFSFFIPLLFGGIGVSTLEVELYRAARYSFNIKFASQIALTEFLFASIIILFYGIFKNKYTENKTGIKAGRIRNPVSKGIEKIFFIFIISAILFFLIFPLISIAMHSLYTSDYGFSSVNIISLKAWKNVFCSELFWKAFANTVKIGIAASGISVAAAICFAYLKLFYFKHGIFGALPFLPLAVSSIMLGFGWKLLNYSNGVLMLILAQGSVYWSFAWSQIQLSLNRIPENVIEAALLISENKRGVFFRTILPLSKKGIACAFAFVFAVSAGDASLPLVLSIDNFINIPLLLFGYASTYRFAESSVSALVLCFLSASVFFVKDGK